MSEEKCVRVVIIGAAGRMGQMLVQCAAQMSNIQLVGAVEHPDHPEMGNDVGMVAGCGSADVTITSDLGAVLQQADAIVDFALHSAVPGNAKQAADAGAAVVIGTTGLDNEETEAVQLASRNVPIVWAPNMSLGVNLLFAMVQKGASVLGVDYAIEVEETHHVHKKDAPSGTALLLGEKAAAGRGVEFDSVMIHDPEGSSSERSKEKIVIRSYRKGEVVGDHTVSFENAAEKLEFSHHASSRNAFALGALRAAHWAVGRDPGLYSMQDVLGL